MIMEITDTYITVTKIVDLEKTTDIPALGVYFSVTGDITQATDWLRSERQHDDHARVLVNVEIDSSTNDGYFVEANAWDEWVVNQRYLCDF